MSDRTLRGMLRQVCLTLLIAGAALTGLSCGGEGLELLTTGILEITTATSGPEPDADGYAVTIDDGAETALGTNATLQRDDVDAGNHSVRLTGMAGNCTLDGQNPRLVAVTGGATAEVRFAITCRATTGSLDVTSATSGPSPDPDGYTITLDGSERGTLGVSGAATLDGLTPGSHAVGLSGVAANCQVQEDNPQTATVTAGVSATVAFAITCAAPPALTGTLRITTTTTGPDPDSDGYAVAVDGGTTQPIGISATASVANVATGAHAVRLSRVAANCSVLGTNPRSVTISGGATAEVSFAITCTAATGSLEIATTTTGGLPDPDGYTVTVDNAAPQTIGATATLTVPGVGPGNHQVTLGGLATNCRVEGENPRSVTVTAGAGATVAFSIACPALQGSNIAFVGTRDGLGGIYVVSTDGGAAQKLTSSSDASDVYGPPAWSPDGSKILFLKKRFRISPTHVGVVADIWAINRDGTGLTNLTGTPEDEEYIWAPGRSPVWSPDGSKIAFARVGPQEYGLFVMDADGTHQRLLIGGPVRDPTWSPDGRRIAFENGYELDVINPDGSGAARISRFGPDSAITDPWWSPDGTRFLFLLEVYLGGDDGEDELWVMNADGSAPTFLTSAAGRLYDHSFAVWSPDGSKIAFAHGGIHTINPDGTGQVRLIEGGLDPDWSPDGTMITFTNARGAERGLGGDVFVMNADGSGIRNLTNSPGLFKDFPTWSPQ